MTNIQVNSGFQAVARIKSELTDPGSKYFRRFSASLTRIDMNSWSFSSPRKPRSKNCGSTRWGEIAISQMVDVHWEKLIEVDLLGGLSSPPRPEKMMEWTSIKGWWDSQYSWENKTDGNHSPPTSDRSGWFGVPFFFRKSHRNHQDVQDVQATLHHSPPRNDTWHGRGVIILRRTLWGSSWRIHKAGSTDLGFTSNYISWLQYI